MNATIFLRHVVASTMFASALAGLARAQAPDTPSFEQRYVHDTGFVPAPARAPAITVGFLVDVPGGAWLRLYFDEIDLPEGAYLRVTSLRDGATQELDRLEARQWRDSSAYMNGDAVWVEILSASGIGPSRLVLERVAVGLPPYQASQCGATDDRVPSNNPRVGRVMPTTCTAWLIDDCNHCMLTAGHCVGSGLQVIEFNVPPSTSGGSAVHPPPEDQYAVDTVSLQFTNGGVGNDWGYFGCFANANTGQSAFERQGASFTLVSPPPVSASVTIRITGCGYDDTPWTANYTQQTATGPYFSYSGTTVRHQADTRGGNSGSPVIWDQNGGAIAVHTHGGCLTDGTGSNASTATTNAGLQVALANPRGVCSCTGIWSTYCVAKINSQGCTPAISATGTPTTSGGSGSFVVHASNVLNNQNGIFFYGQTPTAIPFQGGTLCVAGTIRRTPIQNAGGNPPPADCSGTYAFDMGAQIASGIDANLHAGATIVGQFWSRDPSSPSYPSGLTNAIRFTIGP